MKIEDGPHNDKFPPFFSGRCGRNTDGPMQSIGISNPFSGISMVRPYTANNLIDLIEVYQIE